MQIVNSWIAQEKVLHWGSSRGDQTFSHSEMVSAQRGLCPELSNVPLMAGLHQGSSSARAFSKWKSLQRTKFPWLPVLNSQIHRGFLSWPKWDASWLHTVADHKFTMVRYPPSQEKINSVILIYMAAIFHWVDIKAFFESKMPRKGVKNQILL